MVVRLARAHWLVASPLLQRLGLYAGQELLLMRLWENDHQSQTTLARALGLDPSTVARMVRSLEQQGLITRTPSEADRRAMIISLTDAGRNIREKVEAAWTKLDAVTTSGLSERQRREALRLMRRMERSLTAETAPKRPDEA